MIFKFDIVLFVVATIVLGGTANAARKECPETVAMSKFDAAAFTGRWFDITRTKTLVDGLRGSCASVNFTVNSKQNITVSLSSKVAGRIISTQHYVLMNSNGILDWNFSIGPCEKICFCV